MLKNINKALNITFSTVFLLTPLIVIPFTSELFEFNKMVFIYFSTIIIVFLWILKSIYTRKIIFRRTILDIPIIIFITSQTISTLFSQDYFTSSFGYYSRFHGGLLSSISYSLLYWTFVSNINTKQTRKMLKFLISSAFIISIYAILEKFGIDKNLWVQDVQNRVFSTLGQPNWLAAWIVALTPLTWTFSIIHSKSKKYYFYIGLSLIFFIVLIFTKSRSGIIAFFFINIIFWLILFLKSKRDFLKKKGNITPFIIHNLIFICFIAVLGTPWTKSVFDHKKGVNPNTKTNYNIPLIQRGGTKSSEIREMVWRAAIKAWRAKPIFGHGTETFAFIFYKFKPVNHNLTSEWDFVYNKAHNEYLNFLATTGLIGLLSYISLILTTIYVFYKQIIKTKKADKIDNLILIALFSGYISILITNFFGFSVVPVAIQFFLYPAIAITITKNADNNKNEEEKAYFSNQEKTLTFIVSLIFILILFNLSKYWRADYFYAKGKKSNDSNNFPQARTTLNKAIKLEPRQPIYLDELSQSARGIALLYYEKGDTKTAKLFMKSSLSEINKAISISPNNVHLLKSKTSTLIQFSTIEPKLLEEAINTLKKALILSPKDAKIYYNLGLIYIRIGNISKALETLKEAINLKSNYRNARLAYGILLAQKREFNSARDQFNYILEKINPEDQMAKQQLEEIGK